MISYGTVFFCGILVVTGRDPRIESTGPVPVILRNCILKWAVHRSQKTGVLSGQVFNAFLGTLLLPKNNDNLFDGSALEKIWNFEYVVNGIVTVTLRLDFKFDWLANQVTMDRS